MGRLKRLMKEHPKMTKLLITINNVFQRKGSLGVGTTFVCTGLLQNCRMQINGAENKVNIGDACRLQNCIIKIRGNNNSVNVNSGCHLIDTEFYIEDDNCNIIIGNETCICGKTQLAAIEGCSISIGNHCLFSSEINLRTGDSHAILDMSGNRINPSKDIIIEDHVWIGNRAIILKGVHLEQNTIVATGAVVTKSFPEPNCVLAGNPAKIIRENINWNSDRKNDSLYMEGRSLERI